MSKYKNKIGPEIKRIRENKGLSLREVASRSGLSHSGLSNYENGKRSLDIDQLDKLCSVLGVDMLEFLSEVKRKIDLQ